MSVLVGAAQQLTHPLFRSPYDGHRTQADEWVDCLNIVITLNWIRDAEALGGWSCEWWPTRGGMLADSGLSDIQQTGLGMQLLSGWVSGANGRFGFAGIARDFNGNVLAGATVRCYRVSDGLPVADPVLSDANGYFLITTPYSPDLHFLTVHKSGATPYAGASYDNLVGG